MQAPGRTASDDRQVPEAGTARVSFRHDRKILVEGNHQVVRLSAPYSEADWRGGIRGRERYRLPEFMTEAKYCNEKNQVADSD